MRVEVVDVRVLHNVGRSVLHVFTHPAEVFAQNPNAEQLNASQEQNGDVQGCPPHFGIPEEFLVQTVYD